MTENYKVVFDEEGQFLVDYIKGSEDVHIKVVNDYVDGTRYNHQTSNNYNYGVIKSIEDIQEYLNEYSSYFPPGIRNCRGIFVMSATSPDLSEYLIPFEQPIEVIT